jgi:UDP-N-acetyl-D-mannosaminuronate dehydrogenase
MAADRDTQELVRLYGKAQDASQELSFFVARLPMQLSACSRDLKRGKQISIDNIAYQGRVLKARASQALKAISALHELAAETYPEQTAEHEEVA